MKLKIKIKKILIFLIFVLFIIIIGYSLNYFYMRYKYIIYPIEEDKNIYIIKPMNLESNITLKPNLGD